MVNDAFAHMPSRKPKPVPVQNEEPQVIAAPAPRHVALRTGPKVGRNDPCPCGSGKKHKKCCGAVT